MLADDGREITIFEVTVNHDDHPEGVAEKFLEVFRLMGIAVRDLSDDDDTSLTYAIGGHPIAEGER